MMTYKIIYHVGDEINIKTRARSGALIWQETSLAITFSPPLEVPFSTVVSSTLFQLHGLGTMVKLVCNDRTIFLSVVRVNILGYFVIVNRRQTRELFEKIQARITNGNIA
jgi:hypothetical protein